MASFIPRWTWKKDPALARNAWPLTGMESALCPRHACPSTTTASTVSVGMACRSARLGGLPPRRFPWLERLRITQTTRSPLVRSSTSAGPGSGGMERSARSRRGCATGHPGKATTSWERCADIPSRPSGPGRRVRRCRHPTGEGARNTWSGGRRTTEWTCSNSRVRRSASDVAQRGQPPHRSSTGQGGGLDMSEDYPAASKQGVVGYARPAKAETRWC